MFPAKPRRMVVMDVAGIIAVDFQYCRCDKSRRTNNLGQLLGNAWYPASTVDLETCATFQVLDSFRLLNVVGNVSVHDFVGTLERLTDPLRLSSLPVSPAFRKRDKEADGIQDRYKAFSCIARQYAYMLRAKCAGRAHDPGGLGSTKPGELAVLCWACPHDSKNLPEGWRDVEPQYR